MSRYVRFDERFPAAAETASTAVVTAIPAPFSGLWAIRLPAIASVRLGRRALTALSLFVAVVLLQVWLGAYQTERGAFSDEAAHFMNGMVLREYLATGLGQSPMDFAEQYYLHYPKIAPMMWPPLFHVLLGVLMLPGWSPQVVALLLVAASTAWISWRLSEILKEITRLPLAGIIGAALFLLTTVVTALTTAVMLDMVVAALALEAVHWWSRFATTGARRDALLFGLFAACCCTTKGNGLAVLLVPGFFMALTGQLSLLGRKAFWQAAMLVVVIALPPVYVSLRLDSGMGGYSMIDIAGVIDRTVFYSNQLWLQFGTAMCVFVFIGIVTHGHWWRSRSERNCLPAALTSLVLAALVFHIVNPVEVVGIRYLAMAIAPMFALCALGAITLAKWLRPQSYLVPASAILVAIALSFVVAKPAIASRGPLGYREAANYLERDWGLAGRRVMVVSNETGEGAFVSEVATRAITPSPTVLRGSKVIAFENWNGVGYRLNVQSSSALVARLEDLHVSFLLIDESVALPYSALVREAISNNAARFERVRDFNQQRHLTVYRLRHASPGPPAKVRAEIAALNRVLIQR